MSSESLGAVVFEGDLSIRDGVTLKGDLSSLVSGQEQPCVETGDARSIDIGVLQLLIAAHKSAAKLGKRLRVHAPEGGALQQTMTKSGVSAAQDQEPVWDGAHWIGLNDENRSSGK